MTFLLLKALFLAIGVVVLFPLQCVAYMAGVLYGFMYHWHCVGKYQVFAHYRRMAMRKNGDATEAVGSGSPDRVVAPTARKG